MEETHTPDRNRLPTLYEVLSRRSQAPVDLFSFYIYMRDQQRSVDYLDFWLDVAQHMSLCRHYVRELRRSVLVDTPDMEKLTPQRSARLLDGMGLDDPSGEKAYDDRLSAFLRQDNSKSHSPSSSQGSAASQRPPLTEQNSDNSKTSKKSLQSHSPGEKPRPSSMGSGTRDNTDSTSPQHTVARADIRASAEKILYTYLLKGSEREIVLPDPVLADISHAVEVDGRDDPEVLDEAKDYVFQAMERDAFPGFLRAKALGNLVLPSSMLRLVLGLVAMFAGFWTSFCLIFLDYSRQTRCWVILPFTVGVYCLCAHQYSLDPILAIFGLSEYTLFNLTRVREPYVRKLLTRRALAELLVIVLTTICLCLLFILVPSKRL